MFSTIGFVNRSAGFLMRCRERVCLGFDHARAMSMSAKKAHGLL
jgi:hypothetical protein